MFSELFFRTSSDFFVTCPSFFEIPVKHTIFSWRFLKNFTRILFNFFKMLTVFYCYLRILGISYYEIQQLTTRISLTIYSQLISLKFLQYFVNFFSKSSSKLLINHKILLIQGNVKVT